MQAGNARVFERNQVAADRDGSEQVPVLGAPEPTSDLVRRTVR